MVFDRLRSVLFVLLLSVAQKFADGQGGDCLPLQEEDLGNSTAFSQAGLISIALANNTQPEVLLLNHTIVCIAQGTRKDRWRMVSGVAQFNVAIAGEPDNTTVTMQFHFQCESDGSAWNTTIVNSTEFVLTESPDATLDTALRTDCALCIDPGQQPEANNEQHCVPCASECAGIGLMRCTSQEIFDCCTHFGPLEGQCTNESSCPGNSVSNEMFDCICSPSYTGADCTVDVNECEMNTSLCANGANCTNTDGNFTCDCLAGYTGMFCDVNIDECNEDPCANAGACIDNDGGFTCECPMGFTGSLCDVNVTDECRTNPCMNGGNCTNIDETFQCLCPPGYTGATCKENIDDCSYNNSSSNPCQNGATCIDSGNGFTCNCTTGWSGSLCEVCTLDGCANCTADEDQNYIAVCIECRDNYQLQNMTCIADCLVEKCVNCSQSSNLVCIECENELTVVQDGSVCSTTPTVLPETTATATTPPMSSTADNGRLTGIVVGSIVGGLLLILLVAVIIGAIAYYRKKSRVTITFDLTTIKSSQVTVNPVFADVGREDSGIENDDEITVNRGALEFDDD